VDIDLLAYAQGFKAVSPSFTVANASNGSTTVATNGHTVRFTPKAGFMGLGSFDFTVKGSDATSYSASVSVLVEPSSTEVSPDVPSAGVTEASVVWMDLRGRVLAREIQHLDRLDPRPVAPAGMPGLHVAQVSFPGQLPRTFRSIGIAP